MFKDCLFINIFLIPVLKKQTGEDNEILILEMKQNLYLINR